MELDAYLDRIGLAERPAPTLAGLRAVHRAHLLAIPYDALDIQLKRPVTTDVAASFDKIVRRKRGGWCYEMNGLLGWALGELGFDVTRSTAAVIRASLGGMAEGNHLVLCVALREGQYLADVGFGDGPLDPIQLVEGPFESSGFQFGLARVDNDWWRLTNHPHGSVPSFDFKLDRVDEARVASMNELLQTWDQSPFVQNAVVQRHTPDGLVLLRGRSLRRVTPHGYTDRLLTDADDLVETLARDLGLTLPEAATIWPQIVARHEAWLASPPPVSAVAATL